MSSVIYKNKCGNCGKEFEDVMHQQTCIACLVKFHPVTRMYKEWKPDPLYKGYSIEQVLTTTPCKHTEDGYCLRNENDYCKDGECNCPHNIAEIRTLNAACECETTAEFCTECGEQLTKPKIEC